MRSRFYQTLLTLLALAGSAPAQTITTIAGGPIQDGQSATSTLLNRPAGLAVDAAGNIFLADSSNNLIRRVDVATGKMQIVAGGGSSLNDALPIPATGARLDFPSQLAVDAAGNLYIADSNNHRIRKLTPGGTIQTVAGNGTPGFRGDAGPAVFASVNVPNGVAVDSSGNLYIADSVNHVVRRVDAATGRIFTIAGTGQPGFSGDGGPATQAQLNIPIWVSLDGAGNLYLVDQYNHRVRQLDTTGILRTVAGNGTVGFSGDGGPATAAALANPRAAVVAANGDLLISDASNNRIRRVDAVTGTISTLAGTGAIVDALGGVSDGQTPTAASFFFPTALALDRSGGLLVADTVHNLIRRIAGTTISTVAGAFQVGDGGPGTQASLNFPHQVAVDSRGVLYVADTNHNRIRAYNTSTGTITTVAGTGQFASGGDGGAATSASVQFPFGVAVDQQNNVYVADSGGNRIRKVDVASGRISTIAGTGTGGFSGDGGPATAARLAGPAGVLVDSSGNLWIADTNNHRVRRVDAVTGNIQTVAGTGTAGLGGDGGPASQAALNSPQGLALDSDGGLLIADSFNNRIRKVRAGNISTVAGTGTAGFSGDGGPATLAQLNEPHGIFLEASGSLLVADSRNNAVRRISAAARTITTIAGTGIAGFSGDGGFPLFANMNFPVGVAVDAAGNVYVAEAGNNRLRRISGSGGPNFPPVIGSNPSQVLLESSGGSAFSQVVISNLNPGALSFSLQVSTSSGGGWLAVSVSSGSAPATVTVTADPTGLVAGEYRGGLTITAAGASNSPLVVPVVLRVTGGAFVPQPEVSTQFLAFAAVEGDAAPPAKSVSIRDALGRSFAWTARAVTSDGRNWLQLSPASGTAPSVLSVTVVPGSLRAGTYQALVSISATGRPEIVPISVTFTVTPAVSTMLLSQNTFHFITSEGSTAIPSQTFRVLNAGHGSMSWRAAATVPAGGEWLALSAVAGSSSSAAPGNAPSVEVRANPSGLRAGSYFAVIQVDAEGVATNSPQLATVHFQILPADSAPVAYVNPSGFVFVASQGGVPTAVQQFTVTNQGGGTLNLTAQPVMDQGGNWLSVSPPAAAAPGNFQVQAQPAGLSSGFYTGRVNLLFSSGGVQQVEVLLVVVPAAQATSALAVEPGALQCAPTSIGLIVTQTVNNFLYSGGWPAHLNVRVVDNCGGDVTDATVTGSFSTGETPLVFSNLRTGQYVATWVPLMAGSVTLNVRAISQGREASVRLSGSVGATTAAVLFRNGVVNGASFAQRAPLAAGSIISLFGSRFSSGIAVAGTQPLPRELGGVRVRVGGQEAPLFFVSPDQINAQAPFELGNSSTATVVAQVGNRVTAPEEVMLAAMQPGLFKVDATGQGAILDVNNRLADPANPVARGQVVQIFATGLGTTTPALSSGVPAPSSPLAVVNTLPLVSIGGMEAQLQFAGLAPGFVGLYQVNAVVPTDTLPGNSVPVVLRQGDLSSNTVTIAVR